MPDAEQPAGAVPPGDVGPDAAARTPAPHGPADPGSGRGRWSRRPADDAEARALASGLRLRILRLTLDEPLTNQEIAERLGRNPASVLHHVRTLVATGFLVAQDERRGTRGAREVPYLATGKSWYLATAPGDRGMLDAFVEEVAQVDVGDLEMTRLALRLAPTRLAEVRRRLHELLAEAAEMPSDTDAEPWSVFLALHPDRTRR